MSVESHSPLSQIDLILAKMILIKGKKCVLFHIHHCTSQKHCYLHLILLSFFILYICCGNLKKESLNTSVVEALDCYFKEQ